MIISTPNYAINADKIAAIQYEPREDEDSITLKKTYRVRVWLVGIEFSFVVYSTNDKADAETYAKKLAEKWAEAIFSKSIERV